MEIGTDLSHGNHCVNISSSMQENSSYLLGAILKNKSNDSLETALMSNLKVLCAVCLMLTETLACMHGSAWRGDGGRLLIALAGSLDA